MSLTVAHAGKTVTLQFSFSLKSSIMNHDSHTDFFPLYMCVYIYIIYMYICMYVCVCICVYVFFLYHTTPSVVAINIYTALFYVMTQHLYVVCI